MNSTSLLPACFSELSTSPPILPLYQPSNCAFWKCKMTVWRMLYGRDSLSRRIIDLMYDDVTSPEGSMGVVVTLKSKMAVSSASNEGNSKIIVSFDLSESSNKSPEPLLDGPEHVRTCQHYCHLNFPLRGNTTPYWIRAWIHLPQCTFEPQKHCLSW